MPPPLTAPVAGVDGCPGGWVVVTAAADGPGGPVVVQRRTDLGPLLAAARAGEVAAVAVDMPVGLAAVGPRRCDVEARALLGPRRSTVFPAPSRAALGADDHADACARSRAAGGVGLSIQAFNLLPKIAEIDALLSATPCEALVEAHPELAFLRLHGGRPLPPKRSVEGRALRLRLVAPVLGPEADLVVAARGARVPLVDVLDAAALVATARRLVAGSAELLGGEPDPTGLPMRIAW